ncbi:hypothetical protein EGX06_10460 [Enterococcus hirae]|nr:hypothetical protein EGX06_10460 [Enterococcus hirae]
MFLWLKTLYRKRAVTWPFIFYTIIWTLSFFKFKFEKHCFICLFYSKHNDYLTNKSIFFIRILV